MANYCFEVGGEQYRLQVEASADGYRVRIGDRTYLVRGQSHADGQLDLLVDGQRHRIYTARSADSPNRRLLWLAGQTWTVTAVDPRVRRNVQAVQQTEGTVSATVPGQVRAIQVAVGDKVSAGDPLLMLEAMKMEMRILAPKGGTVSKINCAVGDVIERGQGLVEIEG
jgi:3-methylcrotonyl-CoA carboxylase alpha subunit